MSENIQSENSGSPDGGAGDFNSGSQSIVINEPVSLVYSRSLQFEDIPKIIKSVAHIEKIDSTRFVCISRDEDGKLVTTPVHIVMRIPQRRVAWQVASDKCPTGVTTFEPEAGGATRMTVRFRSDVDLTQFEKDLRGYLESFKRLVEGERE